MAEKLEKQYIIKFNSIKNGYNTDLGGHAHCHSEETKKKIAIANSKRIITKEMREHFSQGQKGNCNRGKPVRCIETGIIYRSVREAARKNNLSDHSAIAACCRNEKGHKTVKGLH